MRALSLIILSILIWGSVTTLKSQNLPPTIVPLPDTTMYEGDTLFITVHAFDPDPGDLLTLTVVNLPYFGTFVDSGNGTGSITLEPGFSNSGSYSNIMVIVTDAIGAVDTTAFLLTVFNVNRNPAITQIANQSMDEGDTLIVPLNASDPDSGEVLTFASYNLPGFGTLVNNSDSTGSITFRPGFHAAGIYDGIRVYATDVGDLTDSTDFILTVYATNLPPVLNTIADTTVFEGDTLIITVRAIDPDSGDTVSLSVGNLPLSATFSDSGDGSGSLMFTLALGDSGIYSDITVFATDAAGLQDSTAFTLTVLGGNHPPQLRGHILDRSLTALSGIHIIAELDSVFHDPDGDLLHFTARSADSSTVRCVLLPGNTLAVEPLAPGQAAVTVHAYDQSAVDSTVCWITVLANQAPVMTHSPLDVVIEHQSVNVNAMISDDTGLAGAALFYRRGGDSLFLRQQMLPAGSLYRAVIPGDSVTSRGLEYMIVAEDITQQIRRSPDTLFHVVRVQIPEPGLLKTDFAGVGTAQEAYRLFSIPLQMDIPEASAVLSDDLDSYDNTRWRFFALTLGQYQEYHPEMPILPGTAYWLLVKFRFQTIDTGGGITISTGSDFQVALHPGWNFIATPFDFPIPINHLRLQSNQNFLDLRTYSTGWNDPVNDPVTHILPYEGYALLSDTTQNDTLLINPLTYPATLPKTSQQQDLVRFEWAVHITAQCQNARDKDNYAAVSHQASARWDQQDFPEPPPVGEYVSVYFPHPEWDRATSQFCVDTRPVPLAGEIWEFAVRTNIHDIVQLNFPDLSVIPEPYDIRLVNERLKTVWDLRANSLVEIAGNSEANPPLLQLIVGTEDYIREKLRTLDLLPASFELFQNFPNPFNPVTTIRYAIPQSAKVSLVIYNILGQHIITLIANKAHLPGYYTAVWDGRNQHGRVVASGLYICHFRSGDISFTRKMLLIK
ncbi:MAG: T9SS type A sorting domain-containing protein [Calditrichaeota bacterium]|nr:T9SS type A sorting domain-containing protein [Calditrichota bacterium]